MSLAEVTRNSFQSGIASSKWLGLCKLLISKMPKIHGSDVIASELSNSVIALYRSYPGDPSLQEYLKIALQDGILPVSTFVATLLQAARSPELHIPATLDTLVRIALDAHYSSGQPPLGSVVSASETTTAILGTVTDALALLRIAHSLPISHFHQLTTSVSELVILLLSCVSDFSQVSTTQALIYFTDVNELMTHYRLTSDVRQVLDTFMVSLTLLIGDDVKVAREAQMIQTMQYATGRGNVVGPNSNNDMVTLGLLLNYLVTYRAHDFGSGHTQNAVALLVASFRSSSWTPAIFYTQLLLSAFTCLAQSFSHAKLWKAFIVGRLPNLLVGFSENVNAENLTSTDMRDALIAGLTSAFRRPDIIVQGDHVLSREPSSETPADDDLTKSFSREFVQQLVKVNLLSSAAAMQLDPLVSNEVQPKWHSEAHDMGMDLSTFLEVKLMQGNDIGETHVWWERIVKDIGSHSAFANIVLKRFSSLVTTQEVESLGYLCKLLYSYEHALDIVALHIKVADLIFYSLRFLDEYDCETVGDPQTAVSHLGDVVLFVQCALARFKIENKEVTKNDKTVSPDYLINTDAILLSQERTQEDVMAFNAWFKALFDNNSEGIEDTILRTTKPKVLLRISPALFSQVIQLAGMHKIEKEVLMNGVSYFTGPLLNWTLVGVIRALAREIQQRPAGVVVQSHYEILQTLVLSPSCPKVAIMLCSPHISLLLSDKRRPAPSPAIFNAATIRQTLAEVLNVKSSDPAPNLSSGQTWYQQVQQAVQTTFSMARLQKTPYLDIKRCLAILPPMKFLQVMWAELTASANLGELEACRRIATFALTIPQNSSVHPPLPIFMHVILPGLIATADSKPLPEQTLHVELLTAIISSVLNATLTFEVALRSMSGDDRLILGQSSTAMARRLAIDLRRIRTSDVSTMILQRLASSQPFVTNFPVFIGELGT